MPPVSRSLREEAARLLYEQHLEQVKHIIRQTLNARIRVREGTSDIFQQALKSFIESDVVTSDPDKLLPRFLLFVQRKCANAAEKHKASKRDVRRETDIGPGKTNKDGADEKDDGWAEIADGRASQPLNVLIVREELNRLSDEEFRVFVLRYEGHSFREIGEELGCPESKARRIIDELRGRFVLD